MSNISREELMPLVEALGVNNDSPEMDMVEKLVNLLSMPEQEFAIMAPLVFESLADSFSSTESKLDLVKSLNKTGTDIEDIIESFSDLTKAVDETNLSVAKKAFLNNIILLLVNTITEARGLDKKIVKIAVETCSDEVILPEYKTIGAAAMDVYTLAEYTINPGEQMIIPTGLKMSIPEKYAVLVQPRSGMSAKTKLRIANTPGLIDSDYRGEIGVIVENIEPKIKDITIDEDGKVTSILYGKPIIIGKGERIAQLRLVEAPKMSLHKVGKLDETARGEGGFGSTN